MNATLVDTQKSTVEPVASHVDPSWKGLYRVGGVCQLLAGLIYLSEVTLGILLGPAPADSQHYSTAPRQSHEPRAGELWVVFPHLLPLLACRARPLPRAQAHR